MLGTNERPAKNSLVAHTRAVLRLGSGDRLRRYFRGRPSSNHEPDVHFLFQGRYMYFFNCTASIRAWPGIAPAFDAAVSSLRATP